MTKILQIYEEAKQKCKTSDRFFSLNVFSNAHLEQKDAGYFLYNLVLTAPWIASKNEQPRVNNELRPVYRQAPCRLHQQGIRKRAKNQKYYDATQQTDLKDYSFTTMILPIIAE
jgi:hypothetical protein